MAFAVRGNFPWRRVPGYIVAQVIGAILASVFLELMYGGIINGATEPTPDVNQGVAVLTEAVLTLGLVSVILGTADGRAQRRLQRRHRGRRVHRPRLRVGCAGDRRLDEPGAFVRARCSSAAT